MWQTILHESTAPIFNYLFGLWVTFTIIALSMAREGKKIGFIFAVMMFFTDFFLITGLPLTLYFGRMSIEKYCSIIRVRSSWILLSIFFFFIIYNLCINSFYVYRITKRRSG